MFHISEIFINKNCTFFHGMTSLMHLEYAGIRVRDLDRSLKFYSEALGLKEVKRGTQYEIGGGIWVLLKDEQSNQHLELNWYPPNSPFASEYVPGEGLDHIGFIVDNVTEKFQELVAKGAAPTEINPSRTGGWVAYVKDPDGNWIEIFQRNPPS
jgi:lactoylglutathione lyase